MIDKNQAKEKGLKIIDSTIEQNSLKEFLAKNFPQTLIDGTISLKAIATLLGINLEQASRQGYELTFTGKGLANALYSTPSEFELREEQRGKNTENTGNAIIIGDNLDALKILKSAYEGKIKMIYIDPPYNTKNDDFIYRDDFRDDFKKILREVGLLTIDEGGGETKRNASIL